jgi:eukaryotic-like serine/threonine-protein kinase
MSDENLSGVDEALIARAKERVGTVLRGKYRVDAVLGIGGMAVVYVVTHRNQKRFALKILHPELSTRTDIRQRFLREGYAANSLDHPGAVAIMDDDVAEDGAAFLVMELLLGASIETLAERLHRMAPEQVLAIAHQALDTLAVAHSKAIVHRDIKPANLFLQPDGTLKVLDFGIARVKDATTGSSATSTGTMLGTPAYMAPEQAMGSSSEIDGLTDVWAVGATMFTLLSHRLVHEAETATHLLIKAATQAPRSLAAVCPEVSPRIVELVDRAIAFEKVNRWPSAAAMRDAISRLYLELYDTPVAKDALVSLMQQHATYSEKNLAAHAATVSADISPAAFTGQRSSGPLPVASSGDLLPGTGKTTGQPVSSSHAGLAPSSATPKRWSRLALPVAFAASAVLVGTIVERGWFANHDAKPQVFANVADAPSTTAPSIPSSASPLPVTSQGADATPKAIKVAIAPPAASVDVDGQPAEVHEGFVELRGAPGTMHIVQLTVGKRHDNFPVLILDSGPVPPKVELSVTETGSSAPRARPSASPSPTPATPSPSAGNVSRTME